MSSETGWQWDEVSLPKARGEVTSWAGKAAGLVKTERENTPAIPIPGVPIPPPRYASADLEAKASWENSLELQRRPQRNAGSSRGKARGLHSLSAFHQLYSPAREKGWGPSLMKTGARKKGRREFQMEKQRNEPESGSWSSPPICSSTLWPDVFS